MYSHIFQSLFSYQKNTPSFGKRTFLANSINLWYGIYTKIIVKTQHKRNVNKFIIGFYRAFVYCTT